MENKNTPTPEEIIQKLAEKYMPFPKKEDYHSMRHYLEIKTDVEEAHRHYKQALRDVLPLIDRWVSVEDRLPDEHTDVLVWVEETKSSLCVEQSSYYNGRFESQFYVTHWKPLPSEPSTSSLEKLLQ